MISFLERPLFLSIGMEAAMKRGNKIILFTLEGQHLGYEMLEPLDATLLQFRTYASDSYGFKTVSSYMH